MKKYTDGKRVIKATERAFEVIYKDQGFKEVKEQVEEIKEETMQEEIKEDEEKLSKRNKKK